MTLIYVWMKMPSMDMQCAHIRYITDVLLSLLPCRHTLNQGPLKLGGTREGQVAPHGSLRGGVSSPAHFSSLELLYPCCRASAIHCICFSIAIFPLDGNYVSTSAARFYHIFSAATATGEFDKVAQGKNHSKSAIKGNQFFDLNPYLSLA